MHKLTRRQVQIAESLSDKHTQKELGEQLVSAEPETIRYSSEIIEWAIYLRQQADKPSAGHGYTGRNGR